MSELTYSDAVENPVQAPSVTQELSENVIHAGEDDLYDWARLSTLHPLMFGTACCFMEFIGSYGPRFDLGAVWGCSPHHPASAGLAHYRWHHHHEVRPSPGVTL